MVSFKNLFGKFYLEPQVKSQISRYYLRDAYEWVRIYRNLMSESEYYSKSFEAKKFVCLRFALECSLKSLIMSLSNNKESASDSYKSLRNHQHDLTGLAKECISRAGRKHKIISPAFMIGLAKIDKLGVGIRYDLDFKTAYKKQTIRELFVDGPVSGVVLDDSFRKDFFRGTLFVLKKANLVNKIKFSKHLCCTLADAGKVEDYIRTKIIK